MLLDQTYQQVKSKAMTSTFEVQIPATVAPTGTTQSSTLISSTSPVDEFIPRFPIRLFERKFSPIYYFATSIYVPSHARRACVWATLPLKIIISQLKPHGYYVNSITIYCERLYKINYNVSNWLKPV